MNRHILLSYLSVWLQGNSTVVGVQFPSWARTFVLAAITLSQRFFLTFITRVLNVTSQVIHYHFSTASAIFSPSYTVVQYSYNYL